MPTYEYECQKCHKTFEVVQSMKDSALKTCLKELCRRRSWGKGPVRRLMSAGAGLIFKGSGFYITDYRSEKYKQAAKKESDASAPAKKEGEAAAPVKKEGASPVAKKESSPKETKKPAKAES